MHALQEILKKKPLLFLVSTFLYLALVALLKWNIHPGINTALFVVGGIIGIYFLDAAEVFFHLTPSPFRTIVFFVLFVIVSLFVVTSSASFLAGGLVLSIFLSILFWQLGEWSILKNLNQWYRMWADPIAPKVQWWIMVVSWGVFILETIIFLNSY
jgi:hypothetical protein